MGESRDTTGLTPRQASMVELWEEHMASEFETADVEATMATMTERPYLNHVPVMTGGVGREGVRRFYATYFIGHHPGDTRVDLVSRTVGESRIVDEMIHSFTHDMEMPWMLPGVEPTGKRIEVPVVAVVEFEGGKIAHEHIYWDQASVLAQAGLLDTARLPITGARQAHKVLDPELQPNELIDRKER
jgi:carboxymethylenebutenolidase